MNKFSKLSLEQRVIRLENTFKRMVKLEAAGDAEVIYKDNLWTVYRVTSYDTAKKLGRGTVWGIAGKWGKDEYNDSGYENGEEFYNRSVSDLDGGFYFYIKNKGGVKICLARKPNGRVAWIEDDEGTDIKQKDILLEEPEFPSIEGVFAPKRPSNKAKSSTALINAVFKGDAAKVADMIAHGADIESATSNGTPLYVAVANNKVDIVKMLLEAGADPDNDGGKGSFFIPMASAKFNAKVTRNNKIVDLLREYGSKY